MCQRKYTHNLLLNSTSKISLQATISQRKIMLYVTLPLFTYIKMKFSFTLISLHYIMNDQTNASLNVSFSVPLS